MAAAGDHLAAAGGLDQGLGFGVRVSSIGTGGMVNISKDHDSRISGAGQRERAKVCAWL